MSDGAENNQLALARWLYALRRRRDGVAPEAGLFGEPGWDILLDLYIAHCCGARVPVSSVCAGASIPFTTILRWLARLEQQGLLERLADAGDARRRLVRLTPAGRAVMDMVFHAINAAEPVRQQD